MARRDVKAWGGGVAADTRRTEKGGPTRSAEFEVGVRAARAPRRGAAIGWRACSVWLGALVLSSAIAGCATPSANAPSAQGTELPVSRVVLYQNGVGYFERSGAVDGNVMTLQIRPSQINDLLKSLTVIDSGTGRAVSASLPLEENADRLLSELPEQVRDAGGLLTGLRVLRGAHVEVTRRDGSSLNGRVLGVENLQTEAGEDVAADWRVSLKTPDDEVVVVALKAIKSVTLHDRTLSVGLERSLDVSLGEGGWKPIALSIRLAGADHHRVTASYIVEMPRWKPAYRLVLQEGGEPLLQGWAIVDNVSGEHWNDVSLSLVSGSPISFKYDLHSPQYAERADLTPRRPQRAVAPPPSEEAGYEEDEEMLEDAEPMLESSAGNAKKKAKPSRSRLKRSRREDKAAEAFGGAYPPPAPAPQAMDVETLARQGGQAQAQKVGALFRYDIKDKVTIPDRSSTLVSIVNQKIQGEEVVYFRPELSSSLEEIHPYRAVKFQNATGFTLEKGPITVYSNGTFVGEGFVERMESGATSFLTFAIDGKVTLDQDGGTREEGLRLLRIVNGMLVSEAQQIRRTTYKVKNLREKPIRAYIRSPKLSGWTLRNRPTGTVESPEALIIPVDVGAKTTAKLDVEWAQKVTRNIAIDSLSSVELLRGYLGSGKLSPKLKQQIENLLQIKEQIALRRKEEQRLTREHNTLSRDQDRVRANLNVLRKTKGNAGLQRELAAKLAKLETDLGKLSGRRVQLSEEIAELEAKLVVLIKDVSLED